MAIASDKGEPPLMRSWLVDSMRGVGVRLRVADADEVEAYQQV